MLIGVDEYQHLPPLPAVRNNLTELAKLFRSPLGGGLPARHCTMVLNPTDIDSALDPVHRAASEASDTLVVYFAGHGMPLSDGSLRLAVRNSERGRKQYASVAFDDLRAEVLDSMAANKVVILDCCYSGAALEGFMGSTDEVADETIIEGTYVMTASAATQAAMAPPDAPLTAFTGELIKAITNGIAEAPDPLGMSSLYRYVHGQLKSQGMPLPQQRASGLGHDIALFHNKWRPPTEKPTLSVKREEWFREIHHELLKRLRDVSALAQDQLRPEFGDSRLIRSLLVARIAVQLAQGKSTTTISGMLSSSGVFAAPCPTADELSELIAEVQFAYEADGLAHSVPILGGLGLFPWAPEGTYMLLSEYWAAQRGRTMPRPRVERELSELWDTADTRVLSAHSSLPSLPLAAYPDPWKKLKAEPDLRVRTVTAMMLGEHGGGSRAWEHWMSTRPWSTLKARHLVQLGGDLVRCKAAQRALAQYVDLAPAGHHSRAVFVRAAEIIEEQLKDIALAIESMSAIEYDLLRERTADEHFQDGCLATFSKHLLKRSQVFTPFEEHKMNHGTWAAIPWWSLVVHGRQEQRAVEDFLKRGGLQLGVAAESLDADELVISCEEPDLGPSWIAARIIFDLRDVVQACEVLLLGRRQSVVVDFLTEHIDEWGDRQVYLARSLDLSLGPEIGATLTDVATCALRRLLPGSSGPPLHHDGVPALDRLLSSSRLPKIARCPR
ncbi:caspase, EACC1-associated type [Streptomyces sp. Ncost-T10-10d]|uniref:caspase family protein n=1 Tax=Streptomyces sp. Ncost-T10-10d TaxID=1839774 RepID=UPI00081D7521|nr:caspase family protein [Streptomyces sp. Ncost-T10-10d]SCF75093.1 Caspase domain-containing protein [Streptomyces sp. Ncost-T10-10d]